MVIQGLRPRPHLSDGMTGEAGKCRSEANHPHGDTLTRTGHPVTCPPSQPWRGQRVLGGR